MYWAPHVAIKAGLFYSPPTLTNCAISSRPSSGNIQAANDQTTGNITKIPYGKYDQYYSVESFAALSSANVSTDNDLICPASRPGAVHQGRRYVYMVIVDN